MARVFSMPQNPQSDSRLCQLPAEIRLIVLRNLLLFQDCRTANQALRKHHAALVRGREEPSATEITETNEQIKSGSNFARSCQLLYGEGLHILYTENTVCLNVTHKGVHCSLPGICGTPGWPARALRHVLPIDLGVERHMLWLIYKKSACRLIRVENMENGNDEVSDLLARFVNFKIVFGLRTEFEINSDGFARANSLVSIARTIRHLRNILFSKNLELTFDIDEITYSFHREDLFLACKILRCRSVAVTGGEVPPHIEKHLAGNEEVRDTFEEWGQVYRDVVRNLPPHSSWWQQPCYTPTQAYNTFEHIHLSELLKLEALSLTYNQDAFSDKLKILLQEAKAWMNVYIEHTMEEVTSYRKNLLDETAQLSDIVGQHFLQGFVDSISGTNLEEYSPPPTYNRHSWFGQG